MPDNRLLSVISIQMGSVELNSAHPPARPPQKLNRKSWDTGPFNISKPLCASLEPACRKHSQQKSVARSLWNEMIQRTEKRYILQFRCFLASRQGMVADRLKRTNKYLHAHISRHIGAKPRTNSRAPATRARILTLRSFKPPRPIWPVVWHRSSEPVEADCRCFQRGVLRI